MSGGDTTNVSTSPSSSPIAIIGGGFGALITYIVLRWYGVSSEDIAVYSDAPAFDHEWSSTVTAIRQQGMRSESEGHFFPTNAPGLASVEALRSRSFAPLVRSWFDAYRPSVKTLLDHGSRMARLSGYNAARVSVRVGDIRRSSTAFELLDTDGGHIGTARHVILAVGHGKRRDIPAILSWQNHHADDARVLHAFDSKKYSAGEVVLVLGDGMTAATEWKAAIAAGACVVAVSRDGFNTRQALNTPRRYFAYRGFGPFQKAAPADRIAELHAATRGSIPRHLLADPMVKSARKSGQLHLTVGDLQSIRTSLTGELLADVQTDEKQQAIAVDRVVVATGFDAVMTQPLLARLARSLDLPVVDGMPHVSNRFCWEAACRDDSLLAVVGPAAQWVLPSADSLVGMRITAREIAQHVLPKQFQASLTERVRAWMYLVRSELQAP